MSLDLGSIVAKAREGRADPAAQISERVAPLIDLRRQVEDDIAATGPATVGHAHALAVVDYELGVIAANVGAGAPDLLALAATVDLSAAAAEHERGQPGRNGAKTLGDAVAGRYGEGED